MGAPLAVTSSWGGDVLSLSMDRPARGNALDAPTVEALLAALDHAAVRSCSAVVLSGAGKNFCTGFDLSDIDSATDSELRRRFVRIEELLQAIQHAPFPVICLAQGRIFGAGVDILCACSDRIAAPGARFRMPGWKFGLALGTRRLMARIGAGRARAVLRDATEFSADEALEWGLLSEIVPEESWPEARAAALARWSALAAPARVQLLAITTPDTRAEDMADLVSSSSRPGLRDRIAAYRTRG